jgi:hypothetical protein
MSWPRWTKACQGAVGWSDWAGSGEGTEGGDRGDLARILVTLRRVLTRENRCNTLMNKHFSKMFTFWKG